MDYVPGPRQAIPAYPQEFDPPSSQSYETSPLITILVPILSIFIILTLVSYLDQFASDIICIGISTLDICSLHISIDHLLQISQSVFSNLLIHINFLK